MKYDDFMSRAGYETYYGDSGSGGSNNGGGGGGGGCFGIIIVCVLVFVGIVLISMLGDGDFGVGILIILGSCVLVAVIYALFAGLKKASAKNLKISKIVWRTGLIIACIVFFFGLFKLSSAKQYEQENIDRYLGKVGEAITREEWNNRWAEYHSLQKESAIITVTGLVLIVITGPMNIIVSSQEKKLQSKANSTHSVQS